MLAQLGVVLVGLVLYDRKFNPSHSAVKYVWPCMGKSHLPLSLAYPEGIRGRVSNPTLNLRNFLILYFYKNTVQDLVLNSLIPNFLYRITLKLYTYLTFCFSFWGTSSPDLLPELWP